MITWVLPRRLILGATAASLAALGVTACGGGSAGSPAASTAGDSASSAGALAAAPAGGTTSAVHACSLLTAARASAIVGEHYSSAREAFGGSMCNYTTTSAPIPLFIIISRGAGAAAWKEEMGTLQEDAGAAPITLSGVGDRAAGGGTEIGVQDGGYIIDVHGGDPSGTGAAFPKSIALAKAIIAGLH